MNNCYHKPDKLIVTIDMSNISLIDAEKIFYNHKNMIESSDMLDMDINIKLIFKVSNSCD